MTTPDNSELRAFRVDNSIIHSLISSQSGTIEKALLEGVANSIDAGATVIRITLDLNHFVIADDGIGFSTEAQILSVFENFGFDHQLDGNGRQVGRFGIGRGQLFAFASNVWRSHVFQMDVDIVNRGLDYLLQRGLPHQPGLTITGTFYKPLSYADMHSTVTALRELVRYATVPVYVNDKLISEKVESVKWDFEDEVAIYSFKRDGKLDIYSQGLFVMSHWAGKFGVAGRVVTKLGNPLTQNMARNDITAATCPVWKHVEGVVRKHAKAFLDKAGRTASLTEGMRQTLARQALSSADQWDHAVFTLSNRKHITLRTLIGYPRITCAPEQHRQADKVIQARAAAVLSPITMARFGVDTPTELVALVREALVAQRSSWSVRMLDAMVVTNTYEESGLETATSMDLLADKALSESQKIAIRALRKQMDSLSRLVTPGQPQRRLVAGKSETADAWTDGSTYVAINVNHLSIGGSNTPARFIQLVGLVVHELLHNVGSVDDHAHDHDFYEKFHDHVVDNGVMDVAFRAFALAVKGGATATRVKLTSLEMYCDIDMDMGTGELLADDGDEAIPPAGGAPVLEHA